MTRRSRTTSEARCGELFRRSAFRARAGCPGGFAGSRDQVTETASWRAALPPARRVDYWSWRSARGRRSARPRHGAAHGRGGGTVDLSGQHRGRTSRRASPTGSSLVDRRSMTYLVDGYYDPADGSAWRGTTPRSVPTGGSMIRCCPTPTHQPRRRAEVPTAAGRSGRCAPVRPMADFLVTGGAGFIGSNFVRYWSSTPSDDVVPSTRSRTPVNRETLDGTRRASPSCRAISATATSSSTLEGTTIGASSTSRPSRTTASRSSIPHRSSGRTCSARRAAARRPGGSAWRLPPRLDLRGLRRPRPRRPTGRSTRIRLPPRDARTRRRRPAPTARSGVGADARHRRSRSATARTTMGRTSHVEKFIPLLSRTRSTAAARSTARPRTCATGSTSTTTAGRSRDPRARPARGDVPRRGGRRADIEQVAETSSPFSASRLRLRPRHRPSGSRPALRDRLARSSHTSSGGQPRYASCRPASPRRSTGTRANRAWWEPSQKQAPSPKPRSDAPGQ